MKIRKGGIKEMSVKIRKRWRRRRSKRGSVVSEERRDKCKKMRKWMRKGGTRTQREILQEEIEEEEE